MALNEEQLTTLDNMKSDDLRAWASQFLATGDPSPLDLLLTGRSPVESLILFVRDFLPDSSYRLRERLKTEIAKLAIGVAPDEDSKFDYLWDVITVATRLKACHLKKVLLPVINGGEFRGKQGRSEDLHYCFIDALTDLGLGKAEVSILRKRDIKDVRYATVAYRALYKAQPEWASKYFPQVIRTVVQLEEAVLEMAFVLEELVDTFDMDFITEELSVSVISSGSVQCIDLFLNALSEAFPDHEEELYERIVENLQIHGWAVEVHKCPPMPNPAVVFMNHVNTASLSVKFVEFLIRHQWTSMYGSRVCYPEALNELEAILAVVEEAEA